MALHRIDAEIDEDMEVFGSPAGLALIAFFRNEIPTDLLKALLSERNSTTTPNYCASDPVLHQAAVEPSHDNWFRSLISTSKAISWSDESTALSDVALYMLNRTRGSNTDVARWSSAYHAQGGAILTGPDSQAHSYGSHLHAWNTQQFFEQPRSSYSLAPLSERTVYPYINQQYAHPLPTSTMSVSQGYMMQQTPTVAVLPVVGDYNTHEASSSTAPSSQGCSGSSWSMTGYSQSFPEYPTLLSTLKPTFRTKPRRFFQLGKVFHTLYTEPYNEKSKPTSSDDGRSIFFGKHGEKFWSKTRMFVIIYASTNHCVAVPIFSYGGKGAEKPRIIKAEHGKIYSGKKNIEKVDDILSAQDSSAEDKLQPVPLRVIPDDPTDQLKPASLIHYGKPITVEHYWKVQPYGLLHSGSIEPLRNQVQAVLQSRRTQVQSTA